MGKIAKTLEIGNRKNLSVDDLADVIESMYIELADAINRKPDLYERSTDGLTSDTILSNGTININNTTNKVEVLTNHSSSAVTWVTVS